MFSSIPVEVAAAASLPTSLTSMEAFCTTAPTKQSLDPVIPEKSALSWSDISSRPVAFKLDTNACVVSNLNLGK
jgi:hypothetical protein